MGGQPCVVSLSSGSFPWTDNEVVCHVSNGPFISNMVSLELPTGEEGDAVKAFWDLISGTPIHSNVPESGVPCVVQTSCSGRFDSLCDLGAKRLRLEGFNLGDDPTAIAISIGVSCTGTSKPLQKIRR